jgi:hypothetical protein
MASLPHPRFPRSCCSPCGAARVGVREVSTVDGQRRPRTVTFDPARSICAKLAGELADEWVELVSLVSLVEEARYAPTSATPYRQTIEAFCTHIDAAVPRPHRASLAGTDPDLHHAVPERVRLLPSRHRPGSRTPAWHADRLRTLIGRRSLHAERVAAGQVMAAVIAENAALRDQLAKISRGGPSRSRARSTKLTSGTVPTTDARARAEPYADGRVSLTATASRTHLLSTELHARFTFGAGHAGWRQHWQSAGLATAAYVVTSTAVLVLHLVQPSAGVLYEQVVYLTAAGLAGTGRFLALRLFVFAGGRTRTTVRATSPAPTRQAGAKVPVLFPLPAL